MTDADLDAARSEWIAIEVELRKLPDSVKAAINGNVLRIRKMLFGSIGAPKKIAIVGKTGPGGTEIRTPRSRVQYLAKYEGDGE